jgi:acetyl-CoA carboxylase carboxyltransferase component
MNPLMTHRLSLLLDPESFVSRCTPDDGELVGGTGTIGGRHVCIIAINPEACGPVDPFEVLQQELALLDLAEDESLPLIHLADRPGRVAMGTTAIPLAIMRTFIDSRGAGRIFARFAHLFGVVPRIAVVFSPIATTLTYPVVECDTVVMTDLAGMSLARPDMVRLMTGDPSPYEDYGGARMHTEILGTSDKLVFSEKDAMDWVRKYIAFFPSHFSQKPPRASPHLPSPDYAGLKDVIPEDPDLPFDMHDVIHSFIDKGSLLEHRALYAREVITAFARVEGNVLGIIANNPAQKGGSSFLRAAGKLLPLPLSAMHSISRWSSLPTFPGSWWEDLPSRQELSITGRWSSRPLPISRFRISALLCAKHIRQVSMPWEGRDSIPSGS